MLLKGQRFSLTGEQIDSFSIFVKSIDQSLRQLTGPDQQNLHIPPAFLPAKFPAYLLEHILNMEAVPANVCAGYFLPDFNYRQNM